MGTNRALNKRLLGTDIEFKWNNEASVTIENLGFGRSLNKDMARIVADYAEPYVPFKSGTLNSGVRISSYGDDGYITYVAVDKHGRSYSKHQYELDEGNPDGENVDVKRYRGVHPYATSRWVHWAWSVWQSQILRELNTARVAYRKFNANDKTR